MNDSAIVPLYQQVKESIKAAIESGQYKPEEKIPSESELSEEYSVSRITVRRAVEELCGEGHLIKMQGRGTFVSKPRIHRKFRDSSSVCSFTELCQNYGMTAGAKLITRQIVPARSDEERFFGVGRDTLLIYIQRVRSADGLTIFLENLFLLYEPFKCLMDMELNNISIFKTIKDISGQYPTFTIDRTIEISRASAEQAALLSIPVNEPLFFLNVHFEDEKHQPLCIGRQYYIGSRYMFEV